MRVGKRQNLLGCCDAPMAPGLGGSMGTEFPEAYLPSTPGPPPFQQRGTFQPNDPTDAGKATVDCCPRARRLSGFGSHFSSWQWLRLLMRPPNRRRRAPDHPITTYLHRTHLDFQTRKLTRKNESEIEDISSSPRN